MNIDYEMNLRSIEVIPQQDTFTDVLKRIVWEVEFFDTGNPDIKSKGGVETYLNTDALSANTFVDYTNLTKTQILEWVLAAQGGTAFLDELLEGGHAATLEKKILDSTLVEKDAELLAVS